MNLKHSIVDVVRGANFQPHLVRQVQSRGIQRPGKEDLRTLGPATNITALTTPASENWKQ